MLDMEAEAYNCEAGILVFVSFEFYIHWQSEVPSDNYLHLNVIWPAPFPPSL